MSSLIQWMIQYITPSFQNYFVGFEDVLHARQNADKYVIINTLPATNQSLLIRGTLSALEEESFINHQLKQTDDDAKIIILYGINCCDSSVFNKRNQLLSLGITEVLIYVGGLFEWLLLQDIYGITEFATTSKAGDILEYRPRKRYAA